MSTYRQNDPVWAFREDANAPDVGFYIRRSRGGLAWVEWFDGGSECTRVLRRATLPERQASAAVVKEAWLAEANQDALAYVPGADVLAVWKDDGKLYAARYVEKVGTRSHRVTWYDSGETEVTRRIDRLATEEEVANGLSMFKRKIRRSLRLLSKLDPETWQAVVDQIKRSTDQGRGFGARSTGTKPPHQRGPGHGPGPQAPLPHEGLFGCQKDGRVCH
jgi:hypothetical protein